MIFFFEKVTAHIVMCQRVGGVYALLVMFVMSPVVQI